MFTLNDLDAAQALVSRFVPPTPALDWPLLAQVLAGGTPAVG